MSRVAGTPVGGPSPQTPKYPPFLDPHPLPGGVPVGDPLGEGGCPSVASAVFYPPKIGPKYRSPGAPGGSAKPPPGGPPPPTPGGVG